MIARLNMGGPAHQVALLSGRRFFPDRYETLLVHGRLAPGEESAAYLSEREGARMVHLPELVQPVAPVSDLRALGRLVGLIHRFRPDIVHTHTAKAGFLGRQAALLMPPARRPALVHTFHGHVLEGYFGATKNRAYRAAERALARRTDRLIGVSEATVADLLRLGVGIADRFSTVPLGLDLGRLSALGPAERARARSELGLSDDEVLCVFIGRFAPIKRLDLLLEAFAISHRRNPRLHLALVGDGERRAGLEAEAARMGLSEAMHLLGYKPELRGILAAADIAVLSSDNEGTPVSLIEAAAAGIPAVSTDVGGVSEVVIANETGALVGRGDASALAAEIERLASDAELRQRMGSAARGRAFSRYGTARLFGDLDEVYQQLCG